MKTTIYICDRCGADLGNSNSWEVTLNYQGDTIEFNGGAYRYFFPGTPRKFDLCPACLKAFYDFLGVTK